MAAHAQQSRMTVSREFVEFICEQLAPLGAIQARAMMGGRTLYCDGVIFALIDEDQVYIKVDAETQRRFEAAGSSLFAPLKDQPDKTMKYARIPDDALDDREALLSWARLGVEAGRRAKTAKAKPATRKKSTKRSAKKAAGTTRAGTVRAAPRKATGKRSK
jgi:DNA transformation protein